MAVREGRPVTREEAEQLRKGDPVVWQLPDPDPRGVVVSADRAGIVVKWEAEYAKPVHYALDEPGRGGVAHIGRRPG